MTIFESHLLFKTSLCFSLLYLAEFLPSASSTLVASNIVLSFNHGSSSPISMSPEAWTMGADTLIYSPSATADSILYCSSIYNWKYSNLSPAKTFVSRISFSYTLSITTGDSNYVLILGICTESSGATRFTARMAGTFILSVNGLFRCRVLETYIPFTLSNLGTQLVVNGSTITLATANAVPIYFTVIDGEYPIINYTILVKGDCSKANYCSMCDDQLCVTCNQYSAVCSNCVPGASLVNSKCACTSSQFYFNSKTPACELCDQLCSVCDGDGVFACNTCSSASYYLIDSVCLIGCPYGFTGASCSTYSAPVIRLNFNQNFAGSYGIFNTGSSAATYQFFASPDNVDPIPSYFQGLYFSGISPGNYLASSTPLWFSHSFTIALWTYSISTTNDLVGKGTLGSCLMRIQGSGAMTLTLQSPSLTTILVIKILKTSFLIVLCAINASYKKLVCFALAQRWK